MKQREIRKMAREIVEAYIDDLKDAEIQEDLDGEKIKSVFIGTVFSLSPSGKYYTPWACSNLSPCPRCKGRGCDYCGDVGSREAFEDQVFYEALYEVASRYDAQIEFGEGDPCDLFLVQAVEEEQEEQ
jgi:hypothetical protein